MSRSMDVDASDEYTIGAHEKGVDGAIPAGLESSIIRRYPSRQETLSSPMAIGVKMMSGLIVLIWPQRRAHRTAPGREVAAVLTLDE